MYVATITTINHQYIPVNIITELKLGILGNPKNNKKLFYGVQYTAFISHPGIYIWRNMFTQFCKNLTDTQKINIAVNGRAFYKESIFDILDIIT